MELKLALCQVESAPSISQNLEKIKRVIEENAADVYLFPELFLTCYGNNSYSEEDLGPAIESIQKLCSDNDVAVAMGMPVRDGKVLRNSLSFITPSEIVMYDKLYLANFAPYNEGIFAAGNRPVMCEWKGMKIGLEICYDVMFPEIHRYYARNGADIVLVASASAEKSRDAMMTVLPSRSLENTVFTAYCNNVGTGPAGDYFGGSAVFSPLGRIMGQAGKNEETLLFVLKREELDESRKVRHHLQDLRDDILL